MKKVFFLILSLISFVFSNDKIIIAHRGASGYLVEHTLESKTLAYSMGVDYIEQDLVMSKDDKLIVIHDLYLDHISDVAQKFPKRSRLDGHFYVIDFTLAELKTLNMSEPFVFKNGIKTAKYPKRFPIDKAQFSIHTFEEEIELIQGLNKVFNQEIGLYVEIKKPWFHKQEGKDIAKATLEILKKYGYTQKNDKVYLQSFDYPDLKRIKEELFPIMGMNLKLIALIADNNSKETFQWINGKLKAYDFMPFIEAKNFNEIVKVVDGVGPSYNMLFNVQKSQKGNLVFTDFVKKAHKSGLLVHPYTLRIDALPPYVSSYHKLFDAILFKINADGVFTDFPDIGKKFLRF